MDLLDPIEHYQPAADRHSFLGFADLLRDPYDVLVLFLDEPIDLIPAELPSRHTLHRLEEQYRVLLEGERGPENLDLVAQP
jgi:hypothetical protein